MSDFLLTSRVHPAILVFFKLTLLEDFGNVPVAIEYARRTEQQSAGHL